MGQRTRIRPSRAPLVAGALVLLAALTACGGGDDATTSPPPSPTPATSTPAPPPTPASVETAPATTPNPTPVRTPDPTPRTTPIPTATATPTPTATVTPTPHPTLTATPAATPPPCDGVACIEPAAGAFEHKRWEPGVPVDWGDDSVPFDGVFFLDVESGRLEGYRLAGEDRRHLWTSGHTPDGAWVTGYRAFDWALLLRRATGEAWRWPANALHLEATSDEHLLFGHREENSEAWMGASTGHYTLTTHDMEVVWHFQLSPDEYGMGGFFSPDGQTIAILSDHTLYLISAQNGALLLGFEGPQREGWDKQGLWASPLGQWDDSRGLRVEVSHWRPAPEGSVDRYELDRQRQYLTWGGDLLPTPPEEACGGVLSPDGRYVAQQQGELLWQASKERAAEAVPDTPWPSVVVADAATCEPLFRVRSASASRWPQWTGRWLANSEGFVVRVSSGFAIATVGSVPELIDLPAPVGDGIVSNPVPSPTGGGRYFAYGLAGGSAGLLPITGGFEYGPAGVYDRQEDLWILSHFPLAGYRDAGPWAKSHGSWSHGAYNYSPSWGTTHQEVRYRSGSVRFASGGWLFLPPKIDESPLRDEVPLRVARAAGQCIDIYGELRPSTVVVGCVREGARLLLAEPDDAHQRQCREEAGVVGYTCYPSVRSEYEGEGIRWYIYVRTEVDLEGWVAHDYLEHD